MQKEQAMINRTASLIGIAVLFLATGVANAAGPKQTAFGEMYLNGLAAGLVIAGVAMQPKGQELFCPPEKLTITGAMLDDIMAQFCERASRAKIT